MNDFQLLIDLHKGANRQGPGGDAEFRRQSELSVAVRFEVILISGDGIQEIGAVFLAEADQIANDYNPRCVAFNIKDLSLFYFKAYHAWKIPTIK